jgi:hypothetical protein
VKSLIIYMPAEFTAPSWRKRTAALLTVIRSPAAMEMPIVGRAIAAFAFKCEREQLQAMHRSEHSATPGEGIQETEAVSVAPDA